MQYQCVNAASDLGQKSAPVITETQLEAGGSTVLYRHLAGEGPHLSFSLRIVWGG